MTAQLDQPAVPYYPATLDSMEDDGSGRGWQRGMMAAEVYLARETSTYAGDVRGLTVVQGIVVASDQILGF